MTKGYVASPAVQRRIVAVWRVLEGASTRKKTDTKSLAEKIVLQCCIPAGVKACRRGREFNKRVAGVLGRATGANIVCEQYPTMESGAKGVALRKLLPERPDWFLRNGRQIIVGYNQLDLWRGGAQTNRAYKYLLNDALYKELAHRFNIRLVCVVGRDFKPLLSGVGSKTKIGRALSYGVRKGRLFHLSGVVEGLGLCPMVS